MVDAAWVMATDSNDAIRNGQRAVELAKRANELTGEKDSKVLDTLAAAQAEAGQFEEAAKTQELALQLVDESDASRADLETRLKQCRSRMPFRE